MLQNIRARRYPFAVLALAALLVFSAPAAGQTTSTSPSNLIPPAAPSRAAELHASAPPSKSLRRGAIFGDVIGRTLGDFKRLPSRETLAWLGVGAALALAAHPADASTSRELARSLTLDHVFEAGEIVGGAGFQLVGSTAAYLAGRTTGSSEVTAVGADLLRAQILSQTLTMAIKRAARRQRPDGTQYSFPSGHSSVSFASATVLQQHYGWKAGALAYGVATYVATSRIQEERHFLSDVAFGAAIGIAAGRTVTIGIGESRLAIAPAVARGGGGVSFSLVTD